MSEFMFNLTDLTNFTNTTNTTDLDPNNPTINQTAAGGVIVGVGGMFLLAWFCMRSRSNRRNRQ